MNNRVSKFQDLAPLLLRIGVGIIFILAGWGKTMGLFAHLFSGEEWGFVNAVAGIGFPLPTFFAAMAALSELIGGFMVLIGLKVRWATPFLMFVMLVAIFFVKEDFNSMRIDITLLLMSASIFITGSGKYAVDALLGKD